MKMKTNTYLYTFLFFILVLSITPCRKKLEEVVPQDTISKAQAIANPDAARTLYTGVYARFRAYNATLYNLGEMRAETFADGLFTESEDGSSKQLYTHNINANNVPYSNWGGLYNLIYNINNVIDVYPKTLVPETEKNTSLAEMYGLRAFIYYTMLKTWGAVPLTTEPVKTINNAAETYKARTSKDSIMLQVKSDIEKSLSLYGSATIVPPVSGKRIYWNKLATLILKGDVNLWSGTLMGGGITDLNTAKNALQEVINLKGSSLKLNTNYADNFNPSLKASNPENIFSVNYELGQASNGVFGIYSVNNIQAASLAISNLPGAKTVKDSFPNVGGANRIGFNQAMYNKLMSIPNDSRMKATFVTMYSTGATPTLRGFLYSKWIGTSVGTTQVYNTDFSIYRYADVLLLMAEAKAKLAQDPSAEINEIRQRAYGSGYAVYANGTQNQNIEAILEENLREFIAEGRRWWALRRNGDAWVYKYVNPIYLSLAKVTSGKGPTMELPISISMMTNDPLLTQTPGY